MDAGGEFYKVFDGSGDDVAEQADFDGADFFLADVYFEVYFVGYLGGFGGG